MDHLLFLILAGIFVIIRWLFTQGGLAKLLEGLNSDLNNKSTPSAPRSAPETRRQSPSSVHPIDREAEEEKRRRKFMEALGMPVESAGSPPIPKRSGIPPVPPIVHPQTLHGRNTLNADRIRFEKERMERKLAERKRQLQTPAPSARRAVPPPLQAPNLRQEPQDVGRYFALEDFDRPSIAPEAVVLDTGMPPVPQPSGPAERLGEILGGPLTKRSELRRMILAQEILGRPKSLQTC